jgi:hypothetical protein
MMAELQRKLAYCYINLCLLGMIPLPGKPAVVSSRALQDSIGALSLLDAGRVTEKAGQKLYKPMFTREG